MTKEPLHFDLGFIGRVLKETLIGVFLGIANRMTIQVPMAFLGWALKSLLGLGILYISWMFILSQREVQTIKWMKRINHNIESLATIFKFSLQLNFSYIKLWLRKGLRPFLLM